MVLILGQIRCIRPTAKGDRRITKSMEYLVEKLLARKA
jgi:hypothetical protein